MTVFLLSTYIGGELPESSAWFCDWLHSVATDFRVSRLHLNSMLYAVVTVGNSSYKDTFCLVRQQQQINVNLKFKTFFIVT